MSSQDRINDNVEKIASFLNCAVVSKDHGKGESYVIMKDGKRLEIDVYGNGIDGGWIVVREK